jgi:hypothetical protein
MQRHLSISVLGSVYDARCEPNLPTLSNMKLPTAETDYIYTTLQGDLQQKIWLNMTPDSFYSH